MHSQKMRLLSLNLVLVMLLTMLPVQAAGSVRSGWSSAGRRGSAGRADRSGPGTNRVRVLRVCSLIAPVSSAAMGVLPSAEPVRMPWGTDKLSPLPPR